MKEKGIKAVGILKIVLRVLNVIIFIISVLGIIKALTPKKKEAEKPEEEPGDLDDYIEDIDLNDYNFPEVEDAIENDDSDDDEDEEDDDAEAEDDDPDWDDPDSLDWETAEEAGF